MVSTFIDRMTCTYAVLTVLMLADTAYVLLVDMYTPHTLLTVGLQYGRHFGCTMLLDCTTLATSYHLARCVLSVYTMFHVVYIRCS
jgi:hypothetical protein